MSRQATLEVTAVALRNLLKPQILYLGPIVPLVSWDNAQYLQYDRH